MVKMIRKIIALLVVAVLLGSAVGIIAGAGGQSSPVEGYGYLL